jgi:DNA-binding MarR family transcriptional regulator
MEAGQVHKLARVLRDLALDATSDPTERRPNAAEALVAADLFEHAPTTVGEIAARTGVVQSQGSTVVAALDDAGVLTRERDPRDARRSLLVIPPAARKTFGTDRGRRSIDDTIRAYLADRRQPSSPTEVQDIVGILSQLGQRLLVEDRGQSRRE